MLIGGLLIGAGYYGASNYDRLVLGVNNFGEDPSPTSDIVLQNDEVISNSTDGTVIIGGILSTTLAGDTNSFQKTPDTNREKFYDTVTVTGATTTSVFIVSPRIASIPVAGDILSARGITDKMIVSRADTTTSVEPYSYLRVR
jgi:hypothetical protein